MRCTWTFQHISATRWALALADIDKPLYPGEKRGSSFVYSPGYESSNPRDIIYACLYLNSGFSGMLSDRSRHLLDQIRGNTPYEV